MHNVQVWERERLESSMAQIDVLFQIMCERNAADLLLSVGVKPCLKISGDIVQLEDFGEVSPEEAEVVLMEIMPERNKEEFAKLNDTDFAYELEEHINLSHRRF